MRCKSSGIRKGIAFPSSGRLNGKLVRQLFFLPFYPRRRLLDIRNCFAYSENTVDWSINDYGFCPTGRLVFSESRGPGRGEKNCISNLASPPFLFFFFLPEQSLNPRVPVLIFHTCTTSWIHSDPPIKLPPSKS